MLRAAIIGLGDVSFIHRLAIENSKHAELVAVCDVNPTKRALYQTLPFYTSIEEMLEKESLDVVHICLPHYLHYPAANLAAEKQVHVFLEKPLAISYEEGLQTQTLEKKTGVKIGVCFQNRCNRTVRELKRKIESGEYGHVTAVKGLVTWSRPETYYTTKPWRGRLNEAGGGTIINQAIHTYDLMQYFAGTLKSVKASLSNLTDYPIEVEDTAVAQFVFDKNVQGFAMTTIAYVDNSSIELQVITTKMKFTIKDNQLYESTEEGKVRIADDERSLESKSYYGPSHARCVDQFYQAIVNETRDYVTVEEALPSMMMIDAMKASSKSNKRIEIGEWIHANG